MKIIRSTPLSLTLLPWVLTGFSAGLLNGLLGAAGGILLVTLLPRLPTTPVLGLTQGSLRSSRDLLGVSLRVMLPVTALSALLYSLNGQSADLSLIPVILLPAAAGGLLGGYLLNKLPGRLLQRLFGGLVALSGIRMLMG